MMDIKDAQIREILDNESSLAEDIQAEALGRHIINNYNPKNPDDLAKIKKIIQRVSVKRNGFREALRGWLNRSSQSSRSGSIDGIDWRNVKAENPVMIIPSHFRTGLNFIIAPEKKGKTTLAMQKSKAIAGGLQFWAQKAVKGRVLYLALQSTAEEMKRKQDEQQWTQEERDQLEIYTRLSGIPANGEKKPAKRLLKHIQHAAGEGYPYLSVVVDMFNRLLDAAGIDINEYQPVGEFLDDLNQFAIENNIDFTVLHHPNKNGTYLGSRAIGGSAMTKIELFTTGKPNELKMNVESRDSKIRQGVLLLKQEKNYTWDLVGDATAIEATSRKQRIIQLLTENDRLNRRNIQERLGVSQSTAGRELKSLEEDGVIEVEHHLNQWFYQLKVK